MGILTPGTELYILICSIIINANTVLQDKGGWVRSGMNKYGNKNVETVICPDMEVGCLGASVAVYINNKR